MDTGDAVVNYYFILRQQLAEASAKMESIKAAVAEQLRLRNGRVQHGSFELLLGQYKAWQYTPRIWTLQSMVTEEKRKEREDGLAKVKEVRDSLILRAR
jgi:hypothetical protein